LAAALAEGRGVGLGAAGFGTGGVPAALTASNCPDGVDAGIDAGADAGADAGVDAGVDGAPGANDFFVGEGTSMTCPHFRHFMRTARPASFSSAI